MRISTRKAIWWCLLASGLGGTLLFCVLWALEGNPPPEGKLYIWPVTTIVMSIISAACLRPLYREEPTPSGGSWHLSVNDLLTTALLIGLLLAIARKIFSETFILLGIPFSILTGLHFLAGILFANRRGISQTILKLMFAAGFVLQNYGAIGAGAFPVVLAIILLYDKDIEECWRFCNHLVTFTEVGHEHWIFYSIRIGFVLLPLGFFLCSRASKLIPADHPSS